MRIIIIRHPETLANTAKLIYGKTESDYTPRGSLSMVWVLNRLKGRRVDAVFSSPMERTVKLATALSVEHSCSLSICEELIEMDFGVFENMNRDQAKEKHPLEFQAYMADYANYKIPGGESFMEVVRRLTEFLKQLQDDSATYVLVTHGMAMKAALAYLLDISAKIVWHFSTTPATILEIEFHDHYGILMGLTSPETEGGEI